MFGFKEVKFEIIAKKKKRKKCNNCHKCFPFSFLSYCGKVPSSRSFLLMLHQCTKNALYGHVDICLSHHYCMWCVCRCVCVCYHWKYTFAKDKVSLGNWMHFLECCKVESRTPAACTCWANNEHKNHLHTVNRLITSWNVAEIKARRKQLQYVCLSEKKLRWKAAGSKKSSEDDNQHV